MKAAVITTNVLDMYAKPDRFSERVNQCLFGDAVSTGTRRKGFVRIVKLHDSYPGWVDERFLLPLGVARANEYSSAQRFVVRSQQASLLGALDSQLTRSPHFLYYGTRLKARSADKVHYRIELPGLPALFVKKAHLAPINSSTRVTGSRVVREAKRFLGVPYLWGGLTPAGFDCSGMVQSVLARFGTDMPRDTRDQIKIGQNVARERTKTGDLVFFDRHIGFAIGPTALIHASVGGGGVRINSLVSGQPDYREDLDRSYRTTRRVL